MFGFKKVAMPKAGEALPGRSSPIRTAAAHFINHHGLKGPYPEGFEKAVFAGEPSGKDPARGLSLAMEAAAHVRQTDHRDG